MEIMMLAIVIESIISLTQNLLNGDRCQNNLEIINISEINKML